MPKLMHTTISERLVAPSGIRTIGVGVVLIAFRVVNNLSLGHAGDH